MSDSAIPGMHYAAEIIGQVRDSYGVIALTLLLVSGVALTFFRNTSDRVKIPIFLVVAIVNVVPLVVAVGIWPTKQKEADPTLQTTTVLMTPQYTKDEQLTAPAVPKCINYPSESNLPKSVDKLDNHVVAPFIGCVNPTTCLARVVREIKSGQTVSFEAQLPDKAKWRERSQFRSWMPDTHWSDCGDKVAGSSACEAQSGFKYSASNWKANTQTDREAKVSYNDPRSETVYAVVDFYYEMNTKPNCTL